MKRYQVLLLILTASLTFSNVYTPHLDYSLPLHIDEWHHITEAIKLEKGEYSGGTIGYRAGFHVLLLFLSEIFDLVKIYQYLPAIWATLTGLLIFYLVNKKTGSFAISIWTMIFFASIKSNVNLLGLWFFTPLSFSIPFIFLYFYLFTEGIEKDNKKFLLASIAVMLFLIFVHSISVLFAIPILAAYSLFNLNYIKKNYKFFSIFAVIPVAGVLFYKIMSKVRFSELATKLANDMQFKYGWGILEMNNSFLELYSLIGFLLAIFGIIIILFIKKEMRKYFLYVIWPLFPLIDILIFKLTGISYLSPYQRNLYYFVIGLPLLSAIGATFLTKIPAKIIEKLKLNSKIKTLLKSFLIAIIVMAVLILAFRNYLDIPEQIRVYHLIEDKDFETLKFMSALPKSTVIAPLAISSVLYPLTGHDPVATISFYGSRADIDTFFSGDCSQKEEIIKKYKVGYVISNDEIDCGWQQVYNKANIVYKMQ